MKPATHDFDVITDAPPAKRRPPEGAEEAPPPRADKERSSGQRFAPPEQESRVQTHAAE